MKTFVNILLIIFLTVINCAANYVVMEEIIPLTVIKLFACLSIGYLVLFILGKVLEFINKK